MTEDEAKTKWCPAAHTTDSNGIYDTRGQSVGFTSCIASECMAWRWNVSITTGQPHPQWGGYCGLAGKET